MTYKIYLKSSAEKELSSLPEKNHSRIIKKLLLLKEEPRPRGVKKLRGYDGFRIRIGEYRILYKIDDNQKRVDVYAIAHRKDVYR